MPQIAKEITDAVKLVASLNSMNELSAAKEAGRKVIDSLFHSKDSLLFRLAYDETLIQPVNDPKVLLDAAFIATCCKALYVRLRTEYSTTSEYWFNSGPNDPGLHAFFTFLARTNKRIDVSADVPILAKAFQVAKTNPTYNIPPGIGKHTIDSFLTALSDGSIRVNKEGLR